ncbi:hypothetical protein L204_100286 [Cryptococcus depauperatus]|nr:hypothetical protein L204_02234 [Cryptococcus depauperatus CBS 7855]
MSRERNELLPFLGQTHEALESAIQILCTLRNLTTLGKGNDLRQEELPALVGVSAILACEKVQSRNCPTEESASKASGVHKSYFRSAMETSRRLLANQYSPGQSSPRRRQSQSSSIEDSPKAMTAEQVLNLVTPKKKKMFDDYSLSATMLTRSGRKHEPAQSSPLRQSVTSTSSGGRQGGDVDAEDTENGTPSRAGKRSVMEKTPTKINKFSTPRGIDLENPPPPAVLSSSKRKREATAAFMALRPGELGHVATPTEGSRVKGVDTEDGVSVPWLKRANDLSPIKVVKKPDAKKRRRVDWTFKEGEGQTNENFALEKAGLLLKTAFWLTATAGAR